MSCLLSFFYGNWRYTYGTELLFGVMAVVLLRDILIEIHYLDMTSIGSLKEVDNVIMQLQSYNGSSIPTAMARPFKPSHGGFVQSTVLIRESFEPYSRKSPMILE